MQLFVDKRIVIQWQYNQLAVELNQTRVEVMRDS